MSTYRGALEDAGYVIIPDFVSRSDLDKIASSLASFSDAGRNPQLAEVPDIAEVIFSPQMLAIAAELLGGEPLAFPDHTFQTVGGGFGYHKDSVDRWDPAGPDWSEVPYPMIRFGIYLEDFRHRSGSLAIQPGSHRGVEYARRAVNVKCQPGDLVAWYFTSTHAANSPSARLMPARAPRVVLNNNRVTRYTCSSSRSITGSAIGRRLVQPYTPTRRVLFFPYALPDRLVARYLSLLVHRTYYQQILRDDPAKGAAPPAADGVEWVNPYPLLDRADPALITDGFYQQEASRAADLLADEIWAEIRH